MAVHAYTYSTSSVVFFFHWCYTTGWHLTSSISCCHSTNSCHHLSIGLPVLLSPFPPWLLQSTFLAGPLSSILITCPALLSAQSLINFTSSYSPYSLYISEFLHLLQNPFSSTGSNIFCRSFLSEGIRFSPCLPVFQVSEPYVSTGLINVLQLRHLTLGR